MIYMIKKENYLLIFTKNSTCTISNLEKFLNEIKKNGPKGKRKENMRDSWQCTYRISLLINKYYYHTPLPCSYEENYSDDNNAL